jgi:hypothetical protein
MFDVKKSSCQNRLKCGLCLWLGASKVGGHPTGQTRADMFCLYCLYCLFRSLICHSASEDGTCNFCLLPAPLIFSTCVPWHKEREREDGLSPRKLQWIAWELLWQTEGVNVSAPQKTHTLNHKYVRRYGVQLGLFATSLKTDLALATMSTVSCHYSIRPSWHTLCKNQDPTRKA